jgi:Domain of unknown function (DUF4124)
VKKQLITVLIAATGLIVMANASAQQQIRKWVDKDGVVHYGAFVPPEYADRDRVVLNEQAVQVGFEQGEITPEERAELDRIAAEEERQRIAQEDASRRDRMLLETYLSVTDIEQLRDRRIELLESQIKVTEQYLNNLRKHMRTLEREAERYDEGNEGAGLPPELALEMSRTTASISLYEENLARTRSEQEVVRQAFAADIDRFVELKNARL